MGFLKKLKKAVKKAAKQIGKVNPLIPGGAAQKQLSNIAQSALPLVGGLGGVTPLLTGAQSGSLPTSGPLGWIGDTLNQVGQYANQASQILDVLSPEQPATPPAPPPPPPGETPGYEPGAASSSSSIGKYALIGGVAIVAVALIARRR